MEILHRALVNELCGAGAIRSPSVEAAMRAVPRHLFLPEVSPESAYANEPIVTKRDHDGGSASSASQPGLVATMLELLDVQPGHHVLEIGAGTGYNAALLAHLAGRSGQVTTVEVDPELAERAHRALAAAGVEGVHVVCGDGEFGHAAHAPYDRLIVTVGAWDVPAHWLDQLAPDGRLVVPVDLRSWTVLVALEAAGGCWRGTSRERAGFIPMRGLGARPRRTIALTGEGGFSLGIDDDRQVDPAAIAAAVDGPRAEIWSGLTIPAGTPEAATHGMYAWMSCALPGFCALVFSSTRATGGPVEPLRLWGGMACCAGDSFAYLATRKVPGDSRPVRFELGFHGFGPAGPRLAARAAEELRTWARDHRSSPGQLIEVYSAGTSGEPGIGSPEAGAPGTGRPGMGIPHRRADGTFVIEKRHARLEVSWL